MTPPNEALEVRMLVTPMTCTKKVLALVPESRALMAPIP